MNTKLWIIIQACGRITALSLAALFLAAATGRAALPEGRSLAIETQGASVSLSWLSIANAPYEVQARSNLVQGSWGSLDTITNAGGVTVYPVTPDDSPSRFFRVLFPQPVVTAGEPARYVQGTGGPYLYVTGDFFYAGDQVRVGGVPAGSAVFLTPSLLRVELPPGLPPGRHDVEVLSPHTGAVLAALHEAVTVVDPLADPDGLLYGPPEAPLATPMALWASKRGYDYYKAASDNAAAGLQNNPYFHESSNLGQMPRALLALWLSKKGYDYYQAQSAVAFDVQEGKKGLNAVNVKLARLSGDANQADASIAAEVMAFMVEDFRYKIDHKRVVGGGGPVVEPFSGDVQLQVVDLALEGVGLDFVWGRTYHSRLGRTGSATNGWTFSYDLHLQPLGGDLLLHNGAGRADRYVLQTNGVYTCPEFFCEGTLSAGVFRLTFADTGYWEFRRLDTSPAAGKLDRIVDRNGNTVALSYDPSGRLAAVIDDLGRTHTVTYDTAGRIASVSDFSSRTVRYLYDGNGDLTACVSPPVTGTPTGNDFPNGKTNSYVYSSGSTVEAENHLLLACVDGLGQTTAQVGYDFNPASPSYLRCASLQRGDHPPTMLTYQPQTPAPDNRFAALRCIVNDPVGNVSELLYDCRGRGIDKKDIRRRALPGQPVTDTANLPIDKLRPEDPEFTVSRWTWNNDSLCTSATAPGGQVVRYTYQGDLEPATPARKRADCRVVRELASSPVDLDGDGVADASERVWQFDYDPRFGTTPGVQAIRTHIKWTGSGWDSITAPGITINTRKRFGGGGETSPESPLGSSLGKGWDGSFEGGIVDCRDDDCDGDRFATSATDPRGNLTTWEYDTHGNCTKSIKKGHYAVSNFHIEVDGLYNSFGQLTAVTNAPDADGRCRVDTFAYSQGQVTACVIDAGEGGLAITTSFEYDARGNVTRVADPRGNDWLFTYNALDQCVRAQSPVNVSARCSTGFLYDASDNLVRCVTQVRGETDQLLGTRTDRASYDALGRLTEVALAVDDAHALTNRFVYDGNDRCVQALGGDAVSGVDPHHAVTFEYDTCGLLYREVAAPGSADPCTTQYDYDANGLVTRVSEGLEETPSVTTVDYDGFAGFGAFRAGFQAKKLESIHKGGSYARSQAMRGQKAKAWMVNNYTAPLTVGKKMMGAPKIGEATAVFSSTQAGPFWVETVWNKQCVERGLARPARIADPMGNVTTFNFDANDNLTVARQFGELTDVPGTKGNVRLAESRYAYDGLDRCVARRDLNFDTATQSPVGDGECATAFAYAPNGACIGITNDLGGVTAFSYDTAGRVYSVRVPGGKSLRVCIRDAAGNVTSVTQTDTDALGGPPQAFTRTYAHDSQNRCVSSTDGSGKTTACAYDSLGRVVRSTDAAGTQTFFHYDRLGRCTATVGDLDGDGLEDFARDITEQATWSNSSGRLLATTDSHGNTTSYTYDSRDRCVAVTCADGTQQSFVWSPRSNLIQTTDPNGTVSVCTYDANGRLTRRDITMQAAGGGVLYLEAFAFDGCDRLVAHGDDDCDGAFQYDSLGACVSETLNGLATASTYDALGNRLSLTYPGGRVLTYAYDASGVCTTIAESGAPLASFAYAGADRLARVTYGNGLSSTFAYDGLDGVPNEPDDHGFGQVSRLTHASTNGTTIKISHLSWDLKENKKSRSIPPPGTGGSTNVLTLEYDRADRLVRSTVTEGTTVLRDTAYSLDRMGNRTNVMGAACAGPYTLEPASPPADYQVNQYTATPCDSRAYDDNGNLVSRGAGTVSSLSFTYDYADRLVSVSDAGVLVASYAYDALGRRVGKTVYAGGVPASTRHYCYDGSCVIEEREDNTVVAGYTVMHGDGNIIQLSRAGAHYFALSDDQGNTELLTDASGVVVEGYDYDDYGAVTFLGADGTPLVGGDGMPAPSSAFGNPYCWGGLRLDAETGLHNNDGGGYYEPQTGRATRGKVKNVKDMGSAREAGGNNPWSGGAPLGMNKGTVKFFNETKGFGMARKAIKEAKIIGNL